MHSASVQADAGRRRHDHARPSVIKVGGITEYLKVAALAEGMGVALAPHSPTSDPASWRRYS